MKTIAISSVSIETGVEDRELSFRKTRRRWTTALLISSIAAIATGIFGLAIAAVSLLNVVSSNGPLASAGTFLLAVTFPLLILVAHCLDRADKADGEIKLALFRQKMFRRVTADLDKDT